MFSSVCPWHHPCVCAACVYAYICTNIHSSMHAGSGLLSPRGGSAASCSLQTCFNGESELLAPLLLLRRAHVHKHWDAYISGVVTLPTPSALSFSLSYLFISQKLVSVIFFVQILSSGILFVCYFLLSLIILLADLSLSHLLHHSSSSYSIPLFSLPKVIFTCPHSPRILSSCPCSERLCENVVKGHCVLVKNRRNSKLW